MKFRWIVALLIFGMLTPGFALAQQAPNSIEATQVIFPPLATLPPVPSASIQIVGNPGPQTVYYWIVANYLLGQGPMAGPFVALNVPNSLSASNSVTITPTYPLGVVSLDVLKTLSATAPTGACACAVATGVASGTISDQSNSTGAYSVAPVNLDAFELTLDNEVTGAGATHLILRQNGAQVADLSVPSGGTIGGTIAATQVGFGTALNTLGGDSNFTWDNVGKTATVGTPQTLTNFVGGGPYGLRIFSGTTQSPLFLQNTFSGGIDFLTNASVPTRASSLNEYRSDGTSAAPTSVNAADWLGNFTQFGYFGTGYSAATSIIGVAQENWTNTNRGSFLSFWTVPLAATANQESMRLTAADLRFFPSNTSDIGGTDALNTPMKIFVGGANNGQILLAPIQDGSAGQAQGVLTAQNGYFLLKAEAPFGSTAWEPGVQEIANNGGIHGQVFITFGGGFNNSAATDATSSILMSNTSLGVQTDFEIINTQGIGIEEHLNQGTWNPSTGAASQANKTGGACAMSAGTTCTFTLTRPFTATPICIITAQGTNITGGAAACSVSSTTVTITAAAANSNTWGALLIGNPN